MPGALIWAPTIGSEPPQTLPVLEPMLWLDPPCGSYYDCKPHLSSNYQVTLKTKIYYSQVLEVHGIPKIARKERERTRERSHSPGVLSLLVVQDGVESLGFCGFTLYWRILLTLKMKVILPAKKKNGFIQE